MNAPVQLYPAHTFTLAEFMMAQITSNRLGQLAAMVLLAVAATAVCAAEISDHDRQSVGLRAERLYNPPRGPIMMHVHSPRSAAETHLVWMTPEGHVLDGPRRVRSGRIDLTDVFRHVATMRRTSYVQLLADHEPVGPALVVQPMLAPLYPVTERARRADGREYTRIIGWSEQPLHQRDQRDDRERDQDAMPVLPDEAEADDGEGADESDDESTPRRTADVEIYTADRIERFQRESSGVRVYVERDVLLATSMGDIRIALRPDHAPNTAWHVRSLVEGGLYNGVTFHRIVPLDAAGDPFVIQTGDPTGEGTGGPGFRLPLEPSALEHGLGVVSMARSDHPDSAGSQFFIGLSRAGTARLDGQYCAFAEVVDHLETIEAIAEVELADVRRGRPVNPPMIRTARLVGAPPREPGRGRPDQRIALPKPQPDDPEPRRVPR